MKKFISLMVLFAMSSFALAQDVEEDDDEEEEEVVEVVKAKPAPVKKAKAESASDSRIGLQYSFDAFLGANRDLIRIVYDMGTGLRLAGGLDFAQEKDGADTKNRIALNVGADYQLGKVLLPYGVGADLTYNADTKYTEVHPFFYTEAELVKNLTLGAQAGVQYEKVNSDADATIKLDTRAQLTFYFM